MHQQPVARIGVERIVMVVLGVWFCVALLVCVSGIFYGVVAPVAGLTVGLLTTLTLLSIFFSRPLRSWVMHVPLRWLVVYHVIRVVAGIGFLVLYQHGALPNDFALVAGWGDIFVGVTAGLVAIAALPITNRGRWWTVLLWNVFGLLDIVRVLSTVLQLGAANPSQVAAVTAFPMSLLPTFVVPLILATHVLIFARLRRRPFRFKHGDQS